MCVLRVGTICAGSVRCPHCCRVRQSAGANALSKPIGWRRSPPAPDRRSAAHTGRPAPAAARPGRARAATRAVSSPCPWAVRGVGDADRRWPTRRRARHTSGARRRRARDRERSASARLARRVQRLAEHFRDFFLEDDEPFGALGSDGRLRILAFGAPPPAWCAGRSASPSARDAWSGPPTPRGAPRPARPRGATSRDLRARAARRGRRTGCSARRHAG